MKTVSQRHNNIVQKLAEWATVKQISLAVHYIGETICSQFLLWV